MPELEDFKPTGSPEAAAGKATDWLNVTLDGKNYRRETNTMPQWAGSCWYYLRYHRSEERNTFCDPDKVNIGCRSICTSAAPSTPCCTCCIRASGTRCCSTAAMCHMPEPFQQLVNQGMILGEMEYHITPMSTRQSRRNCPSLVCDVLEAKD